jgi:hypothetical protein
MNEETYWIKWLGATVCVLIVSIASCCSYSDYLSTEQVKSGINPMDVMCAKTPRSDNSVCILYLERMKK